MAVIQVAAYCRVSTDKEDQANSFLSQQQFFRKYVSENSDWELYGIYADEGITGTSTKKRAEFNKMIRDANDGRFSLILTKEVSRFSRNILDTIAHTRQLKDVGVGVLFLNDRINTMDPEAEIFLSFLASMAQEESRRTSSRVVWGQTRQMEKGIVFGTSLLGYQVRNGTLSVDEEGAELVRLIFHKYVVEQRGTSEIARFLTQEGYRTSRGNPHWTPNSIIKILKNEKYVGDLVQKKTYTPNFLTHEKSRNQGQVPIIKIENHHEPIVSREIWEQAQEKLNRNNKRSKTTTHHSNLHSFSGKIQCGCCGADFVGRFRYGANGSKKRIWRCGTVVRYGAEACGVGVVLKDEDAKRMVTLAIGTCVRDSEKFKERMANEIGGGLLRGKCIKPKREAMQREIERILYKKEVLLDHFIAGTVPQGEMEMMRKKYDDRIDFLSKRMETVTETDREVEQEKIKSAVISMICGRSNNQTFYKTIVESITVYSNQRIELKLKGTAAVFVFSG